PHLTASAPAFSLALARFELRLDRVFTASAVWPDQRLAAKHRVFLFLSSLDLQRFGPLGRLAR
ncbi:MAG: hypothetical protein AAF498_09205, partial [Pseudomonadota bacterium]